MKKKKASKPLKVFLKSFLLSLVFLMVASLVIASGIVFGMVSAYIKAIPSDAIEKITDISSQTQTTIVYDTNGVEVAKLHGAENRIRVSYSQIPENLINAFVAIEDERFWQHNGIDPKRIVGAIFRNIQKGSLSEGASTITQQLVRNKYLSFEKTFKRKIQEQYLALQVEKVLTKEQILEEYLNTINLGSGAYGVAAAAYTYFGKDVGSLSIAECAMIAGITQSPYYYNPYMFFERAKHRQEVVLAKMLEQGYISQEEYQQAVNEKLTLTKKEYKGVNLYSHTYFVDAVIDEVTQILMDKKDITKSEAQNLIYSGGLKIYATMDENLQNIMEEVFNSRSYMPKIVKTDKDGVVQPQAAAILIEQRTGKVLAVMGGRGDIKGARLLNRATMSTRQPGSAIKPIAVYSLALENGYTAPTIIDDVPFSVGNYSPKNWYKSKVVPNQRGYKGFLTLRGALQWSANIPAVKTAYKLGVSNVYRNLKRFGITTLSGSDAYNLSIAIGGFTYGVKPIELTAAYAAIANRGIYKKPYFVEKILDKDNNVIYEAKSNSRVVMEEKNAYILTDILRTVVTSQKTVPYKFRYTVAGKTGTTDDSKDRWFVGFTPYYTLGVWVGEDEPRALNYLTGVNPSLKIFKAIMDKAMSKKANIGFTKPDGLVEKYICLDSGKLATELCKNDQRGSRVVKEIFVAGTEPTEYCDVHVKATICNDSKQLANSYCPKKVEKVFIIRDNPIWFNKDKSNVPPDDYMYQLPSTYCTVHKESVQSNVYSKPQNNEVNIDVYSQQ